MVYKPHHKRTISKFCVCCHEKLKKTVDGNAVCEDCSELARYDVAG